MISMSGPDAAASGAASGNVSISVPRAALNSAGGGLPSPSEAIGSSMNYVQGMQGEGRTQSFAKGATEGKGSSGGGGILSKVKDIFTGGGGGGAEAGAAGLAEDAAVVA